MARKGTKIKRYGNIYGRGSGAGSWAIMFAMLFGVLLFGFAGWSLYTPVHDFIMELGSGARNAPSVAVLTPEPAESLPDTSKPVIDDEPQTGLVPPADASEMRGIFLPQAQLIDDAVLSKMLQSAADANLNTVIVDAKDATGTVLFSSENALAQKAGAISSSTYSAEKAAADIIAKGLTPAARIHAFRDSITSYNERGMAVHYYDTDIFWYDNSPELGGKPWLNPYSQEARQYIISLANELCTQGFKIIFIDSVQFPSGVGLEKAGYGASSKEMTRAAVLEQFVNDIEAAVKAQGADLIICAQDGWAATGDEMRDAQITAANNLLYGGSPAGIFTSRVMLPMPADATLWSAALSNSSSASQNTVWIGCLPAFSADGTLADCVELTSLFRSAGGRDYILFNPQGNYKLQ